MTFFEHFKMISMVMQRIVSQG